MKKVCKVICLPTTKSTGIFILAKELWFSVVQKPRENDEGRHIHILSDDWMQVGDVGVNLSSGSIFKILNKVDELNWNVEFISGGNISNTICLEPWSQAEPKKIIASSDRMLCLPGLSDDFLSAYCKAQGKGYEQVNVEYDSWKWYDGSDLETLKKEINNVIIAEKILEKTYTKDQVEKLIELAWATASAYGDDTGSEDCADWIKHNL